MATREECQLGKFVVVIPPYSKHADKAGVVVESLEENQVCRVQLECGSTALFYWEQLMPYRPRHMLESLIDLALALGPAAEEMFDDWVIELKLRFKN